MDYIIVGAGPSGLTAAWYLTTKLGKKCTVIDSNISIGGCHRVVRDSGYIHNSSKLPRTFSEHGPRIYSGAYKNFQNLLKDMGGCFDDFFTPYTSSISSIGAQSVSQFQWHEIWAFTKAFFILGFAPERLTTINMLQFMNENNFTPVSKDYVDRLCRLTDGAGSNKYSLYQFMQLINQQSLYDLYQPRFPNDQGLFAFWRSKLEQCGVQFMLGKKVRSIIHNAGKVQGVELFTESTADASTIKAPNVILAIPPIEIYKVLQQSKIPDAFGFDQQWVIETNYLPYQNVVFQWNKDVLKGVPRVWGFPASKWGVAHIILSDFFTRPQNVADTAKVTISTCTTIPESYQHLELSKADFIAEVFDQLKQSYPDLPPFDEATLNNEIDTAYVAAAGTATIPHKSYIRGLYNTGTHNGGSYYAFTSMESAVTNAIDLVNEIGEDFDCNEIEIEPPVTLWLIILILIIICILGYLVAAAVIEPIFGNLTQHQT